MLDLLWTFSEKRKSIVYGTSWPSSEQIKKLRKFHNFLERNGVKHIYREYNLEIILIDLPKSESKST